MLAKLVFLFNQKFPDVLDLAFTANDTLTPTNVSGHKVYLSSMEQKLLYELSLFETSL